MRLAKSVQAGFDLPVATAKWFAALYGRPGWRLYLAYDGQTPIASGAAFAQYGVAWFGMDATLTDFRRRGAQTALINRRIEDGRALRLVGFTAETGQPPAGQEAAHTSVQQLQTRRLHARVCAPKLQVFVGPAGVAHFLTHVHILSEYSGD